MWSNNHISKSFIQFVTCSHTAAIVLLGMMFTHSLYSQSPSNDECTGAIPLHCGDSLEVTTTGWTPSTGFQYGDVWYSFLGNGKNVYVDVCGQSETYGLFVVRSMTDCDEWTDTFGSSTYVMECNHNYSFFSKRIFYAQENWTYYILLRGNLNLSDTLEIRANCADEPVFGCDVPGACNYNPDGEWMNTFCDFVSCNECGVDSNYIQIFTPLPVAFDAGPYSMYSYSFGLFNSDGDLLYEVPDLCFTYNDYELYCQPGENVFLIGNNESYYRKQLLCLPLGCYTIQFHEPGQMLGTSWFLGLPGHGNVIAGELGHTRDFCVEPITGCSDLLAINYNAYTQVEGSCLYPGDFDEDGSIGTSDVLLFIASFGCIADCGNIDLNDDGIVNVSDLIIFMSYL